MEKVLLWSSEGEEQWEYVGDLRMWKTHTNSTMDDRELEDRGWENSLLKRKKANP
jgi:hypothetical protein